MDYYIENISEGIQRIGFKAYGKIIQVEFTDGVIHRYKNIPNEIFNGFKTIDSHQEYYVENLRDSNYEYDVVQEGKEIDFKTILKEQQRHLISQFVDYNLKTLSELIEEKTVDLHQEYQRRFRWNNKRQSKLIESFIMNVPVPPIFLNEDDFGKYSVIDGKQRLNSIYKFLTDKLELEGLDVFQDLNGKKFSELPPPYQNFIKTRGVLRAIIILNESDEEIKYEVFHRLNTGGVSLNAQEIRNNAYPGDLNDLLLKLSGDIKFQKLLGIEDKAESTIYQEMKDVEYVLRFFTFFENPSYFSGDIAKKMTRFIYKYQKMEEERIVFLKKTFLSTIKFIFKLFGEYAFKRWWEDKQEWKKKITTPLFDAVIFACVELYGNLSIPNDFNKDEFILKYKNLFLDEAFNKAISYHTGTSQAFRIRKDKVYNLITDSIER